MSEEIIIDDSGLLSWLYLMGGFLIVFGFLSALSLDYELSLALVSSGVLIVLITSIVRRFKNLVRY